MRRRTWETALQGERNASLGTGGGKDSEVIPKEIKPGKWGESVAMAAMKRGKKRKAKSERLVVPISSPLALNPISSLQITLVWVQSLGHRSRRKPGPRSTQGVWWGLRKCSLSWKVMQVQGHHSKASLNSGCLTILPPTQALASLKWGNDGPGK